MERDIRTCYRWETELGLPVYRFDGKSSRSKVFAYKSEIDQWLKNKTNNNTQSIKLIWKNKWMTFGLISGLILLLGVLVSFYFFEGKSLSTLSRPAKAVLPLDNHNSSEYENFSSEELANEIFSLIAKAEKLIVIPLQSDLKYNRNFKDREIKYLIILFIRN